MKEIEIIIDDKPVVMRASVVSLVMDYLDAMPPKEHEVKVLTTKGLCGAMNLSYSTFSHHTTSPDLAPYCHMAPPRGKIWGHPESIKLIKDHV